MPICPNCKHSFKCLAKVCPNLIAKNQYKSFKSSYKKNTETFIQVTKFIEKQEYDSIISTNDIINYFSVNHHTNGDLLRKTIEWLVCRGLLVKTEFGNSSKGHRYKVKYPFHKKCQHYAMAENLPESGSCVFDWKEAQEIAYDEGKKLKMKKVI